MPRRAILSAAEQASLLPLPDTQDDLIQHYTLNEADMALVRQRRGDANRLGFAVQLCLLRFPGYALGNDLAVPEPVIQWVARQIRVDASVWVSYGERDATRREHLLELRAYLALTPFGRADFRFLLQSLADLAMQTDKGIVLATHALAALRHRGVILPAMNVIDRACSEGIARANRYIYRALIEPLEPHHLRRLDGLLEIRPGSELTWLAWLRQSPRKPNSRYMIEHIARLKVFQGLALPEGIGRHIHQNRLLKMAREGGQMVPRDLTNFEKERRYATLVALAVEGAATVTDELVDLHDRILVLLFSAAKNKHQQQFQKQGKAINDKVRLYTQIGRALVEAKQAGMDPYAAIEAVLPWDEFTQSVAEAAQLAQPESFDHLHLVGENFNTLRRYTPEFLEVLKMRAAPAGQVVLDAIDVLRDMNLTGARKVPDDAPTAFIKARWRSLVLTQAGIDRRFYELCALSELKNSLRSGDIWVQGSRQFRDFDEYLLPASKFDGMKRAKDFPIAINTHCDQYLQERLEFLDQQLSTVNRLAQDNELPDAIITDSGLKITPLDAAVPETAQALIDQAGGMLPRVKITELLMDVDDWIGFTRHFPHLKTGEVAKDRTLRFCRIKPMC